MTDAPPSIFLSYCHRDSSCADQIDADLQIIGTTIIRDARSIRFTEDIPSYMKRIRKTDFALLLISDSFLKSGPCMNEVLELLKDDEHSERILPVVIPDYEAAGEARLGARIYSGEEAISYTRYWTSRLESLRASGTDVGLEYLNELAAELKMTQRIASVTSEFIALLRRIKHVQFPELVSTGYRALLQKLGLESLTLDDIRRAKSLYHQAIAEKTCERRVQFLDRALQLYPAYPEALNKRGQVKDELKQFEAAIKDYNAALAAAPFRAASYINRSYAQIRIGNLDEALNDLNKAIELEPNHKEAFNNRADVFRRLGRAADARRDIASALRIDENFDLAYATKAELEASLGNIEAFYEDLSRAVELGYPLHKYSFDDIYTSFLAEERFKLLIAESSSRNDRFI